MGGRVDVHGVGVGVGPLAALVVAFVTYGFSDDRGGPMSEDIVGEHDVVDMRLVAPNGEAGVLDDLITGSAVLVRLDGDLWHLAQIVGDPFNHSCTSEDCSPMDNVDAAIRLGTELARRIRDSCGVRGHAGWSVADRLGHLERRVAELEQRPKGSNDE